MMKPDSFTRNSIQLHSPDVAIKQLLIWLAENAQELGLLICCVETSYESGTKGDKVFSLLKKEALNTLALNSEEGDNIINQKNLGSLVFYMHNGDARGLCITFGRYEAQDPTIAAECKKDIYTFIDKLPATNNLYNYRFQLPLLRMCLSIYAFKKTLAAYSQNQQKDLLKKNEYAILGFSDDALVYSWPENNDVFRVDLSHAPDAEDEIYLQVVKPVGTTLKKDKEVAQLCLRLVDGVNGLNVYDRSALPHKKLLGNNEKNGNYYKSYYSHLNRDKPAKTRAEIEQELIEQLKTRMVNEALWNALLEALLTEANIQFKRLQFTPTLHVLMPKEQHDEFALSVQPLGANLSSLAQKHQRKKGFALCYTFMATDDTSETELEELRATITRAVAKLNAKDSATQLYLKEVPFNPNLTGIDIVIDIKEKEKDLGAESWKSSHEKTGLDYYGQYRKKAINAGKIAAKQLISSYLLTSSSADSVLYRCVTDVLLKKWLASKSVLRQIQAKLPPLEKREFMVMGTKNWRQINNDDTPSPYNFFTAFYRMSLTCDPSIGNSMQIQEPQISCQWGAFKPSKKEVNPLFSYLDKIAVRHSHAQTLHLLLNPISLNTAVMDRMIDKFLNHDTTYLFEVKNNALVSIWEILPEYSASLIPDIHNQFNIAKDDFRQFIIKCLQDGLFSRDEKYSRIIENKRLVADAEYEIQYSGNEVLIARKIFSEKQHTKRVLLRRMRRIYHIDSFAELQEHDLQPILAGLIGDAGAQSRRSGAKQSFYEKLIKLMISD